MGCFSCFDSKEDEKLNPNPQQQQQQETHHHHHDHNLPSHVSRLPSAASG
jgi:serine/threonine-protein kinase PBS1